jgi:hypothetical protein
MAKKSKLKASKQPALVTAPPSNQNTEEPDFNFSIQSDIEAWIYWHYFHKAFCPDGTYKD